MNLIQPITSKIFQFDKTGAVPHFVGTWAENGYTSIMFFYILIITVPCNSCRNSNLL